MQMSDSDPTVHLATSPDSPVSHKGCLRVSGFSVTLTNSPTTLPLPVAFRPPSILLILSLIMAGYHPFLFTLIALLAITEIGFTAYFVDRFEDNDSWPGSERFRDLVILLLCKALIIAPVRNNS